MPPTCANPSNTRSRCRSKGLRLVAGSVVAGLMLGLSAGAAPAYAQDRVAASTSVKSEHVQGIESDLVSAFFKAAAGKGAGFIFDQLVPNADAQKLDEISDQLKELSAQVKALQISIAEIEVKNDKYEYTALYGKFQTYRNHVIELNNNLQLIGSAASRLAATKVAYDKDPQHKDKKVTKEYQDAQSNLAGRKTNFYQEGKEQDPLGNVQSIRELLYPETGNDTIVDAYGQYLMGTNHIVNADSSAALRKVYDTLEQVQALAAFMQVEFIIAHTPKGGDPNEELAPATAKFKADIDSQRAILPEPIPMGAAVNVGANYAGGTVGKPFFLALPGSCNWWSGDRGSEGGALSIINYMNDNKVSDGADVKDGQWSVPSRAALDPVYFATGTELAKPAPWAAPSVDNFNKGFAIPGGNSRQFKTYEGVWLSDHQEQDVQMAGYRNIFPFDTHVRKVFRPADTSTGVLAAASPDLSFVTRRYDNERELGAAITKAFDESKGRVIATGTATKNYMPLANPKKVKVEASGPDGPTKLKVTSTQDEPKEGSIFAYLRRLDPADARGLSTRPWIGHLPHLPPTGHRLIVDSVRSAVAAAPVAGR